ncbi:uncharacterized protein LOC143229332 isoform X10 [Tachypleus tridentatus]|uniref:uncharacterized protein LOC143229332 isoform X10 n=1 Tax=Tachypleus tridentatus TaxID=6853 RepID=UPI003FD422F0
MQQEFIRDKQAKKKKVKTWSEAAKLVLEMHPKTPMNHTDILDEIQATGVKDVSGSGSLVCLSAALRAQSRGPSAVFYRVSGANSVFGLKSEIPEGALVIEVEEDLTEEIDVEEASGNKTKSICNQKVLCVQLPPSYNRPSNSRPSSKLADTGAAVCEVQNKRDLKSSGDMLSNLDYSFNKSITKNERTTSLIEKTKVFNGNFEDYPKTQKRKLSSDEEVNSMADLGLNKSVHSPLSSPVGSPSPGKISQSHSQRAIKHALRQQQKRRKRNTAIAANSNSTPTIPRIIMKPLPPPPKSSTRIMSTSSVDDSQDKDEDSMSDSEKKDLSSTYSKPQTMRELLASIPGLSLKPRKRSNKKLSTAAQIAQTKKGCIDVETPDSILVNINLKALINKHTFASLPSLYQYRLVQLLPSVDRVIGQDYSVRLSASALSNEFFARACQDWQKRLAEGEFTPENQQKMKAEVEKEKGKLDPWKLKYFEPVWGKKSIVDISDQGKTSSFRMGTSSLKSSLNTPTKHVPTIKIKPVVKKNRLVPAILKHRPQGTTISSGLGNPLQNKVTSPKEVANISSPLKRPTKVIADPETSVIKKQKTSILPIAPKPSVVPVVTVPCEESSAYQSVFLTTSPCSQNTEPNPQPVHQQQAPVMSLSNSPRFNLGTTSGCISRDEKFQEEYLIITTAEKGSDNEEVSDQEVLNSISGETNPEQGFELNFRESDFSQPSDCPVACQPVLVAGSISEFSNSDCFDRDETKKRSISCISVTQSTDSIHNFSMSVMSSEAVRPFTAPPALNQVLGNNVIMIESQRKNSLKRSSSCKEFHEPLNTKYCKTTTSIEKNAQTTSVSALPNTSVSLGNFEKLLPKQTSDVSPSTNKSSSCSVISSNGITPTLSLLKDTKIGTSVESHAIGVSGKTITSKTCHNSGAVVSTNHIQSSGITTGGVLTNHIILNSFPYPHSAISSSVASGKSIFTCSTPLPTPGILDSQNLVSCTLPQPEGRGLMTSQNVSLVPALTQMSVMSTGVVLPQVPKNGVTAPSGGQEGRNTGLSLTPVTMTTGMVIGGGIPGSGVPPGDPNGGRGNCACNLKAMVMCQKCGAFCHDDCIGPSRLCVTCLIR